MIPPKVVPKLRRRIQKLEEWRFGVLQETPLEAAETMEHYRTPPGELEYAPAPPGSAWGRHWGTVWFRGHIEAPRNCRGRKLFYRMRSDHEKMLFVDGKVFAGMDRSHHVQVLLSSYARGGEQWTIHIEGYCGHTISSIDPYSEEQVSLQCVADWSNTPPPLPVHCSELLAEREQTAGLYFDADVLLRTALLQDENSRRRHVILDTLNQALDLVPMDWEEEDELEAACKQARRMLAPLLKEGNPASAPSIGLVGHAHIDVAWFWSVRESIRKAARTFSTVLELMKEYPSFRFIQSQPVLYQMIEDHYPELLTQIKRRVKEGRWEPNGGMWVEADCNISGGEALVRQFLEGRKKTMELFGYKGNTLWLPDVFGYSAAMPQILQGCEIDHFVTSKINWNDTNLFPYSTFWWQGIDGTEVFTHFITTRDGGYNAQVTPESLHDTWNHVQQKETAAASLSSVGWGDGGGGPTREICEYAQRLTDLEGCPKADFVQVGQFLKTMREAPAARPRWVGELYFELHRGTYTAQARTKQANRRLEFLLRETEAYCVMAMMANGDYPSAELQRLWRVLLTNQFHDILPGSSAKEVYETAAKEYERMEEALNALRGAALTKLSASLVADAQGRGYALANSLSWPRDAMVVIADPEAQSAVDAEGKPLPVQRCAEGLAVLARVPAMGVAPVALRGDAAAGDSPFSFTGRTLETPHYEIEFDKAGRIRRCFDKDAKRELLEGDRRFNLLYTAEDRAMAWDAWDLDRFYRDTMHPEDRLLAQKVEEDGPLFFVLRMHYRIGRRSELWLDMVFHAHSRRIDFRVRVNWLEKHRVLKAGFQHGLVTESMRHEIQFGHVIRPTHANTSWDQARFEVCAHKWVDCSEGGYGLALLNDAKYGHDALDGMLSITLLRAPTGPDPDADQGVHHFTYALLPHSGDFSVERVVREAYALNVPVTVHPLDGEGGDAPYYEFCRVDNPHVVIEAVKKAEADDAVIVRLYEAGRTRGPVELRFGMEVRRAYECNMMEEQDKGLTVRGNVVALTVRPFEIKTLKVYLR